MSLSVTNNYKSWLVFSVLCCESIPILSPIAFPIQLVHLSISGSLFSSWVSNHQRIRASAGGQSRGSSFLFPFRIFRVSELGRDLIVRPRSTEELWLKREISTAYVYFMEAVHLQAQWSQRVWALGRFWAGVGLSPSLGSGIFSSLRGQHEAI